MLPAVALLLGAVGVAAQLGVALVRTQEAASLAARVAVADGDEQAREAALEVAGATASVRLWHDDDWIRVEVTDSGPWGLVARGTAVSRAQD